MLAKCGHCIFAADSTNTQKLDHEEVYRVDNMHNSTHTHTLTHSLLNKQCAPDKALSVQGGENNAISCLSLAQMCAHRFVVQNHFIQYNVCTL